MDPSSGWTCQHPTAISAKSFSAASSRAGRSPRRSAPNQMVIQARFNFWQTLQLCELSDIPRSRYFDASADCLRPVLERAKRGRLHARARE